MNIYISILALMISSCYGEKNSLAAIKSQIKINNTKKIISILSSDSLMGRDNKNMGYFKAADYVIKYFKKKLLNRNFYEEVSIFLVFIGFLTYLPTLVWQ